MVDVATFICGAVFGVLTFGAGGLSCALLLIVLDFFRPGKED